MAASVDGEDELEFAWDQEHADFRARLRAFIARELPDDWVTVSGGLDNSGPGTAAFALEFCPRLADAGLLIPHWPKEWGGDAVDPWHHWILGEEMWEVGEPRSYQYMNVNWAGPALFAFGTEDQINTHIPRIRAGKIYYCQGFSEPEAGSDLASLRTRAEPTDTGYLINGSKIWTSAASFADYCVLLARTGGEGRHGITVFLIPMDLPGINVRVVPGVQGVRSLHQVFLDNVEVPASMVLGEENKGWDVVRHILFNERIGSPGYSFVIKGLDSAVALLKARGLWTRADVRARAAQVRAACEAARLMAYKVIDDRVKNLPPTAETSLGHYAQAHAGRLFCDFVGDFLQDALLSAEDPMLSMAYRRVGAAGLVAGSAEIQLDIAATELLGLPRGT